MREREREGGRERRRERERERERERVCCYTKIMAKQTDLFERLLSSYFLHKLSESVMLYSLLYAVPILT